MKQPAENDNDQSKTGKSSKDGPTVSKKLGGSMASNGGGMSFF